MMSTAAITRGWSYAKSIQHRVWVGKPELMVHAVRELNAKPLLSCQVSADLKLVFDKIVATANDFLRWDDPEFERSWSWRK